MSQTISIYQESELHAKQNVRIPGKNMECLEQSEKFIMLIYYNKQLIIFSLKIYSLYVYLLVIVKVEFFTKMIDLGRQNIL